MGVSHNTGMLSLGAVSFPSIIRHLSTIQFGDVPGGHGANTIPEEISLPHPPYRGSTVTGGHSSETGRWKFKGSLRRSKGDRKQLIIKVSSQRPRFDNYTMMMMMSVMDRQKEGERVTEKCSC